MLQNRVTNESASDTRNAATANTAFSMFLLALLLAKDAYQTTFVNNILRQQAASAEINNPTRGMVLVKRSGTVLRDVLDHSCDTSPRSAILFGAAVAVIPPPLQLYCPHCFAIGGPGGWVGARHKEIEHIFAIARLEILA